MKARILLLVIWYGIVFAIVGTSAAKATVPPGWKSAPHLTQVVRTLTGIRSARVYCGYREGAAGEAWKSEGVIALAPDVCSALKVKRPITPAYPRSSTAEAIFTLAHEAGHLVTPGGVTSESQADCYATKRLGRYARALGFPGLLWEYAKCWR